MNQIINKDCLSGLKELPAGIVYTCVTSPPYFGLRDYGVSGQLGLEPTPAEYIDNLVSVFREIRRVLREDGTAWLNLGDSYSHGGCGARDTARWPKQSRNDHLPAHAKKNTGLKPGDLIGVPWRVALALQADGWYLRSDIIWAKPNPMPESVKNRPTKSHEYIFLLAKSERYYYDHQAVAEPSVCYGKDKRSGKGRIEYEGKRTKASAKSNGQICGVTVNETRNRRDVWTVPTRACKYAHFATFPPELIRPCVLAGAPPGGLVLDPFMGSGTTAQVASEEGREYIGFELNPKNIGIAAQRLYDDALANIL